MSNNEYYIYIDGLGSHIITFKDDLIRRDKWAEDCINGLHDDYLKCIFSPSIVDYISNIYTFDRVDNTISVGCESLSKISCCEECCVKPKIKALFESQETIKTIDDVNLACLSPITTTD